MIQQIIGQAGKPKKYSLSYMYFSFKIFEMRLMLAVLAVSHSFAAWIHHHCCENGILLLLWA